MAAVKVESGVDITNGTTPATAEGETGGEEVSVKKEGGEDAVVHSTTDENGQSLPPTCTATPGSVPDPTTNSPTNASSGAVSGSDVSLEPPTDLESAIIKQVEFYFGDVNLPRDNFLKEQAQLDDGWIPLTTLVKCNRLAKLTIDTKEIATALRKSQTGLMEVFEDDSKVRRNPDRTLKVINFKELNTRTLYIKGFPCELSVDEVLTFFESNGIDYESIHCRRERPPRNRKPSDKGGTNEKTPSGGFKGSVFALFKSDRSAMDFLSRAKKGEKTLYGEIELEVCSKEEYVARKAAERNQSKQAPSTNSNRRDQNGTEPRVFDWSKCGVVHLSEVKGDSSRENLKSVFQTYTRDLFISFERGSTDAFLRFLDEDTAQKALEFVTKDGKKLETPHGEFKAELIKDKQKKEEAIAKLKQDDLDCKARQKAAHGNRGGRGGGGRHFGGRGGGGSGGGGGNRNPFNKNRSGFGKREGGSNNQGEGAAGATDGEPKAKHSKFDSDHENDS